MNRKISDIDKLDEISARIKELAQDLVNLGGVDNITTPFVPETTDLEDPQTILTVKDEEVLVKKYLSPEMQAQADVRCFLESFTFAHWKIRRLQRTMNINLQDEAQEIHSSDIFAHRSSLL